MPFCSAYCHDRLRERMLRPTFDGQRDLEQLAFVVAGQRMSFLDLGPSHRERPGLVERRGPNRSEAFEELTSFHQHAAPRRCDECRDHAHGRGDHECAHGHAITSNESAS
jgi:hypothetical protein